MNKHSSLF